MQSNFKRIIILDDDSFHNTLCTLTIKKTFPDLDLEIFGFTDPTEGLCFIESTCKTYPYLTMLFLDINMPGLNGWQVLERLELMDPAFLNCLVIYMLSSSIDPKDFERAQHSRLVKEYLRKPLSNYLYHLFTV